MAGVTGLEPATSGVTGRRSNQLSYTPEAAASRGRRVEWPVDTAPHLSSQARAIRFHDTCAKLPAQTLTIPCATRRCGHVSSFGARGAPSPVPLASGHHGVRLVSFFFRCRLAPAGARRRQATRGATTRAAGRELGPWGDLWRGSGGQAGNAEATPECPTGSGREERGQKEGGQELRGQDLNDRPQGPEIRGQGRVGRKSAGQERARMHRTGYDADGAIPGARCAAGPRPAPGRRGRTSQSAR